MLCALLHRKRGITADANVTGKSHAITRGVAQACVSPIQILESGAELDLHIWISGLSPSPAASWFI